MDRKQAILGLQVADQQSAEVREWLEILIQAIDEEGVGDMINRLGDVNNRVAGLDISKTTLDLFFRTGVISTGLNELRRLLCERSLENEED